MDLNISYLLELFELHLIESTFVALTIVLLLRVFRISRASTRFSLTRLALIKFLLPVGALLSHWNAEPLIAEAVLGTAITSWVSSSRAFVVSDLGISFWWIGFFVWIIGFVVMFSRYCIGWMSGMKRVGQPIEGSSLDRVRSIIQEPEYENLVSSICIDRTNTTPIFLVGIFRPRIVISDAFFNALSDNELCSALRHEIAHWKRLDNFWRVLQVFVLCLFWFHPLVWYVHLRLCFESECACDEAAMAEGIERREYANCMLKAVSMYSRRDYLWASALLGNPLKKRINYIANFKNGNDHKMKIVSIWALIVSLVAGSSMLVAGYQSDSSLAAKSEEKIYNLKDLDTMPKALYQEAPEYPAELKKSGTTGYVVVEWAITRDGLVVEPIAKDSSHVGFEKPALDAVSKSKWEPGTIDGETVNVLVSQRIGFDL